MIVFSGPVECEKKFLVKKTPGYLGDSVAIVQNYLIFMEGDKALKQMPISDPSGYRELRISKEGQDYWLTIKIGTGISGVQLPSPTLRITGAQYESLLSYAIGNSIHKTRCFIPGDAGEIYYLEIYREQLSGLITVEAKFESEEASRNFIPPSWFGREITDDIRYKNRSLALFGLPAGNESFEGDNIIEGNFRATG